MELLYKNEILESYNSTDDDSLFIDPLLSEDQIGNYTVDLRLGYDFIVSITTRRPSIQLLPSAHDGVHQPIRTFFQETRRDLGDNFVIYPNQVVLATTLEYISLPESVYADILARSSYARLGLVINTMVQPGYRGCISLELFNHGNTPIELIVGSRICQIRMFKVGKNLPYMDEDKTRKYFANVRPTTSAVEIDDELSILHRIKKSY